MKTLKTILKIAGLCVCVILVLLTIVGLITQRESKQPEHIINLKEEGKRLPFKKPFNAYGKYQNHFSNFRRTGHCA